MKKTFQRSLELNPLSICWNFVFHVGFTNTVFSNKTPVRDIYFIFLIHWLVQKVITNFMKDIDVTIILQGLGKKEFLSSKPGLDWVKLG